MSNEINIEEMERLANAATPGPWKLVGTVEQAGGDYKDIIPTSVSCGAFCQGGTPDRADEADLAFIAAANPSAILALLDRLKKAEAELERANELVADLQAERSFLLAERAEREKQDPVAWLDKSTEERPGDTVWLPDDLQGMGTRGLVPLYAAPPVTTQHEPVTTVEDRYNADGKSCRITDDLPAGMPLYAAPPVAAPVRLTDDERFGLVSKWVRSPQKMLEEFASQVETAVLRANGFKVEDEQ